MLLAEEVFAPCGSRPPRGGRGLKFKKSNLTESLARRPPRGGRGLKSVIPDYKGAGKGRPPRGGRGLKFNSLLTPVL